MSKMTAEDRIKAGLKMVLEPNQVVELRALAVHTMDGFKTYNGFFDDHDALAEAAAFLCTQGAKGVYFTPNPLRRTISAAERNTIGIAKRGGSANDRDIAKINWLLVDIDPSRPVNTSSNKQEKDAALSVVGKVRAFLESKGWPEPLFADSGNGYHLMYRCEGLTPELHKRILDFLSFRFSRDAIAVVDQAVYNPSRIWKVYGTFSRKGVDSEERPWPLSHVISKKSPEKFVQQQQLHELLADSPEENERDKLSSGEQARLGLWLHRHFPELTGPEPWAGKGKRWVFNVCPWDQTHTDRSAYVIQFNGGGIAAGCLHKNCPGHEKDSQGRSLGWEKLQDLAGERFVLRSPADLAPSGAGNYNLTDLGNAKRMIHAFGIGIRYCAVHDAWYFFDDTRWKLDMDGAVHRCAKLTAGLVFAEASSESDRQRRRLLEKHALRSESSRALSAMVSVASTESEACIAAAALDADPWLFNVANGTMDLRTGVLSEHDRTDLITKLSPIEWSPEAECPLWDDFILYAMEGDESLVDFMHRFFGYCLTGLVTEQVLLFMEGTGGNGKTTALLVLMHVLGEYAIQGAPGLLMAKHNESHPTEVADLEGARFVANAEVEKGKPFAEALIKQLTGSDPIKARKMRKDFYQFMPSHKLCIAANHRPIIKGNDEGIWRRVIRIPWRVKIPSEKKDPFLFDKLKKEAPGILNRLVAGCLEWQKTGLRPPDKVRLATTEYREEMDVLAEYMEDRCVIEKGKLVPKKQIYLDYVEWCEDMKQRPQSYSLFCRQLSERDFRSTVTKINFNGERKSVRVWRGITLKHIDRAAQSPAKKMASSLGWTEPEA